MKLTGTDPGSPPAPVRPRRRRPTRTVIAQMPVPEWSGDRGRSQTAVSTHATPRPARNGHAVVSALGIEIPGVRVMTDDGEEDDEHEVDDEGDGEMGFLRRHVGESRRLEEWTWSPCTG